MFFQIFPDWIIIIIIWMPHIALWMYLTVVSMHQASIVFLSLFQNKTKVRKMFTVGKCNWCHAITILVISPKSVDSMWLVDDLSQFCYCFKVYFNLRFKFFKKFLVGETSDPFFYNCLLIAATASYTVRLLKFIDQQHFCYLKDARRVLRMLKNLFK